MMKLLTVNQLKFAGLLILLTISFRFGLTRLLNRMEFNWIWVIAVSYGFLILITAWILIKKDFESHPFGEIGFTFHLITYIACNLIAELWFLLGFNSKFEELATVHITAIAWGIGLLIHFIFFLFNQKNTIKGIEKSDIFE